MLKVLEVCTASSPAHALVFARAQSLNQQYGQQLQIDLLCSDGKEVELMRQQGMRVIVTDLHRSLNPLRLLQSGHNLYKVLKTTPYDVVHLHFGVPSLVGRILALFMRTPLWIYQSHGYSIAGNTGTISKTLYLLIERALKHSVDLALFQSMEDIRLARTHRLLDDRQMIYLGNGIDTLRFRPPLPSDVVPGFDHVKQATIFGMVARFETIKNHRLLLDAVKYLRLQNPDFKVLLIGQGERQTEIEAQIKAHALEDWVEIQPYSHNMPAFYQQIDVGILTSYGEGLPRALLEPMACGKPVICTDVKGSREVIENNVSGFFVPLNAPQQLAEKMAWFMEHPQQRLQMGDAARLRVEQHFSEQDVINRLGQIYLVCLKRNATTEPESKPESKPEPLPDMLESSS